MKETPLIGIHEALGARLIDFAGWRMPVWYEGITTEHNTVRNRVGLFDVSHMGEFTIRGRGALDFLGRMLTNDAAKLEDGQAHYTIMPNEHGGTVDDLLLYRIRADDYMMVVNASNIGSDRDWLVSHLSSDVEFEDISDNIALLALQGPRAIDVLPQLTNADVSSLKYYHFLNSPVAGVEAMISRTGYTGEDGFEIMVAAEEAEKLWNALYAAGETAEIGPAGLGARDSLRLEASMALYGHELDDETSALEAGLGFFVKLDSKTEMMGLERYRREKAEGVSRKLIGLELLDRGVPRQGYPILSNGSAVGSVTSGMMSPTLEVPIAMGYVPPELGKIGTDLAVQIRDRAVPARVVKRPFYRRGERP